MKNIQRDHILVGLIVAIVIIILGFYYIPCGSGYLSILDEVYLNANDQEKGPDGKISMTDGSRIVRSLDHGKAVEFTTTDSLAPILFEQNIGSLIPSKCPNVFGGMSLILMVAIQWDPYKEKKCMLFVEILIGLASILT